VQSGYWLLLGVLLVVGGLYVADLAWAEVMARQWTIALQKALGWRSSTVFCQVIGQVTGVGALAATVGVAGTVMGSWLLGWKLPDAVLLLGAPVGVVLLCIISGLYPAWLASRTPPNLFLRAAGLRYGRTARWWPSGVWGYALRGLLRRRGRTLLNGLAAALSSALLILLLEVTLEQRGYLAGTLLGEYIAGHISAYHYGLVGLGFGLMTLGVTNSLLEGAMERRREIGVLKAIGWRTFSVAQLFVMEGFLVGLLGGAVGALLGGAAFFWLYRAMPLTLGKIGLLGMAVPGLVGALAALYPARVAARVSPAVVMRKRNE
ncbi:MAG: ABC transporter permease, partial [Anaerolineae bacterium]|nr:ABC transporter permease [Anaerolineae bacterium]